MVSPGSLAQITDIRNNIDSTQVYIKNIHKGYEIKKSQEKINHLMFIIFTQPLRSGRIWHKVNF